MTRIVTTGDAPPPFSAYAQGVEVPAGARRLHVSGQVGVSPEGRLAESVEGQIETAIANVFAVLAAGGMAREDIVDMLVIVTRHETVPVFRAIRDRMLGGHLACSTMLVCGLANPDWEVEIAVTAARAD